MTDGRGLFPQEIFAPAVHKFLEKIKDLLDMEEDQPFEVYGDVRFHSSLAGGGTIFNDGCQMFEDTLYFIIDWRIRNE